VGGRVLPSSFMRRGFVCLAIAGIVLGCGPSLRRVQQSSVYFERCYAADFDARIPLAEKHACWSAWREHYTIGQPRDRRDYASGRIYAIEHGESVPRLPGLPQVALGPQTARPVTAVSVTENDPRPVVEEPANEVELPAREERERPRPLPRTANPACAAVACEPSWRRCIGGCAEGSDACETACNVELSACARGCF
jgi:hypothetical protein